MEDLDFVTFSDEPSDLTAHVASAVAWAVEDDDRAGALAQIALHLSYSLLDPKSASQEAALSRELRATLEELSGLRDGDDAAEQLLSILSTPIQSGPPEVRHSEELV